MAEELPSALIEPGVIVSDRPVRALKAFRKIRLKPGERQVVAFTLRRADLLFIGQDLKPTVEPGRFTLWIAPSAQAEGVSGAFTLV